MSSEPAAPADKSIALDANILVRALLGRHVPQLLQTYARRVRFLTIEAAFDDAEAHLPLILARRVPPQNLQPLLREGMELLSKLVTPIPQGVYAPREVEARQRLSRRDMSDWPYLALALTFGCPIWTEDQDFFGSGVPTWTTDRVEIYLSGSN